MRSSGDESGNANANDSGEVEMRGAGKRRYVRERFRRCGDVGKNGDASGDASTKIPRGAEVRKIGDA